MRRICSELAWLSRLFHEFGMTEITPVPLKCDNQAAIYIASNPVFHERTKHIELDCHFVREKLQEGLVILSHVSTNDHLADVFTKSLSGPLHEEAVSKLNLRGEQKPNWKPKPHQRTALTETAKPKPRQKPQKLQPHKPQPQAMVRLGFSRLSNPLVDYPLKSTTASCKSTPASASCKSTLASASCKSIPTPVLHPPATAPSPATERALPPPSQSDFSKLATTFFVSNFPGHWISRDLWKAVERCGLLVDAFVPRRRDCSRSTYGFVRFLKVKNIKVLLDMLNEMVVEGYKLRANVSKYPRGKLRNREMRSSREEKDFSWGLSSGNRPSRKGYSYRDVLRGDLRGKSNGEKTVELAAPVGLEQRKVKVPGEVAGRDSEWLKRCLVGEMKDLELLSKCMSAFQAYGLGECDIKYLGGLYVLLVFNSPAVTDCFLRNQKVNWSVWFDWLKAWEVNFSIQKRMVWLNITGVPADCWVSEVFSCIAKQFGEVMISFDCQGDRKSWSCGKICILTKAFGIIDPQEVEVSMGSKSFKVIVKEEGEWQPVVSREAQLSDSDSELNSEQLAYVLEDDNLQDDFSVQGECDSPWVSQVEETQHEEIPGGKCSPTRGLEDERFPVMVCQSKETCDVPVFKVLETAVVNVHGDAQHVSDEGKCDPRVNGVSKSALDEGKGEFRVNRVSESNQGGGLDSGFKDGTESVGLFNGPSSHNGPLQNGPLPDLNNPVNYDQSVESMEEVVYLKDPSLKRKLKSVRFKDKLITSNLMKKKGVSKKDGS
ncbi:hypothetical protein LXL04_013112 [Taraxacum kok-saghyz]